MAEPTLHEKRPDAEVIVYGDTAPITAAEWHCARLVFALHGEALDIDATVVRPLTRVAGGNVAASRATRAEAVAALTKTLTEGAKAWSKVYEARAARLRALVAEGCDRG